MNLKSGTHCLLLPRPRHVPAVKQLFQGCDLAPNIRRLLVLVAWANTQLFIFF